MAKRLKDIMICLCGRIWSRRLQEVTDKFDVPAFYVSKLRDLEVLEFTQRQELLAKSIKECFCRLLMLIL